MTIIIDANNSVGLKAICIYRFNCAGGYEIEIMN